MDVPRDLTVVPLRRGDRTTSDGEKADRSLSQRDDDELMQLACAGVEEAFTTLVRRYEARVRRYCSRMCGGAAAGDDVAQESFVQLWRTRQAYEPCGRLRSYLFTIVHSRCLNAVRARRRDPEPVAEGVQPTTGLDALLEAERARRMESKLALLPPKLRQALALRFAAELEYDEMAALLGRPQATVRSRVFHGVARLRKLLGKDVER